MHIGILFCRDSRLPQSDESVKKRGNLAGPPRFSLPAGWEAENKAIPGSRVQLLPPGRKSLARFPKIKPARIMRRMGGLARVTPGPLEVLVHASKRGKGGGLSVCDARQSSFCASCCRATQPSRVRTMSLVASIEEASDARWPAKTN